MPSALSPALAAGFAGLALGMAVVFVWGAARAPGVPRSARATLGAVGVAGAYLGVSFALARAGVLADVDARPPPAGAMLAAMSLGMVALAFSRLGDRLLAWPLAVLVGVQAFRIAVEILLAATYRAGVLPAEMTYHGLNFDVASGVLALGLGVWVWRGTVPRGVVLAWNAFGLMLLGIVVAMAALSAFGVWATDPRVTLPTMWPGVWLPAWLVQLALLGHVLVFRKLAQARRAGALSHLPGDTAGLTPPYSSSSTAARRRPSASFGIAPRSVSAPGPQA